MSMSTAHVPQQAHAQLSNVGLLTFLSASSQPVVVLNIGPLQAALAERGPLSTPRWERALERLNVRSPEPASDGTEGILDSADDDGITPNLSFNENPGDYFSAKPPEYASSSARQVLGPGGSCTVAWSNRAYASLVEKLASDYIPDNDRHDVSSHEATMDTSIVDGPHFENDQGAWSLPATERSAFQYLSESDREDLLSFMLDVIENSPEISQPISTSVPSSVHLSSFEVIATMIPNYLVLTMLPRHSRPHDGQQASSSTITALYTSLPEPTISDTAGMADLPMLPGVDLYTQMLSKTEIGRAIRDFDWASTELGPIPEWCPELKAMVSAILSSPYRECILLGENRRIIYNEAYTKTALDKHPRLLGLPAGAPDAWGEIWDDLEPVARRTMNGETVAWTREYLPMVRQGFVEETYHTFAYHPFTNAQGKVIGIHNFSMEETDAVVAARRLGTVRDLIERTALARSLPDFTAYALETIASNPDDVSFALMYTVTTVTSKATKPIKEVRTGYEDNLRLGVQATCCGAIGVPENHPFYTKEVLLDLTPPMSRQSSTSGSCSTPTVVDGETVAGSWQWPFEEACLKRDLVFVDNLSPFAESLEKRWEEPPRQAVVIPIMVEAGQTVPQAVIIFGIGSRAKYTDLYATFFKLIGRHIAVGMFAVMTAEIDAKRAEELVRLDKAKTSFFNNVSHELRTPLTLVLGPLEDVMADKSKLSPVHYEKLHLVQRHASRLLTMVNKLLDFSSIEGGRMQVKFRPTPLGTVTRDLGVLFRDAVERGGLQYILHCEDDPPDAAPMYIALELWDKVVFNVIGNAVKYCRKGSIEVTLRQTLAEAVFSVKDTGVGIPAQDLSRIFERFHRVDESARTTSGTGIGLALTLEIVKVLGGLLEVESIAGQGSTFTVRLPRGFTHLPIEQVVHEAAALVGIPEPISRNMAMIEEATSWREEDRASIGAESSSGDSTSGAHTSSNEDFVDSARLLNFSNRTVMLVEDSPDLSTYISSILSKHFKVIQMPDGLAAWEHIQHTPPSLIITDQMMPRMDGMSLVAAIRNNPATALLPVIMISAQAGSEARVEALERGLDDYLCKPFQARELLARVNVHLQLGLMRAELEKRVQERTSALIDSEGQVRALADKFATLSRVSPVGILQTDAEGRIVYSNPRFYDITGHRRDKPLHQWRDGVVEEDQAKLDQFIAAAIASPDSAELESLEIRFKHREDAWGQFDIRSFKDFGGRDGFVAALTDISRQKKAEALHVQTVEARRYEAEENRRNTEAFLDMSSHELRNPLSGVWQNAELLSNSLDGLTNIIDDLCAGKTVDQRVLLDARRELSENVDSVESILICASHQGRIADDILNVSKLNMGLLSVVPIPFDLTSRIGEAIRMFEAEAIQKRITLSLAVGDSVGQLGAQWIMADPSRLSQCLLNFLSNAIKYTMDANERSITVHLDAFMQLPPASNGAMRVSQPESLDLTPGSLWIVVGCQDSGKGLSSEELKKLFAKFSQANPRSDQYGGSGLGLYVSKKLVELHHGFIEVESSVGKGSTFRFYIPAELASPPTGEAVTTAWTPSPPALRPMAMMPTSRSKRAFRPAISRAPSSKHPRTTTTPTPPHILVVEDNIVNQKVMQRQLKLAGYTVTVANNGREGLDYLIAEQSKTPNDSPICACLMDIEMPVMGGLEAIQILREMERKGEVPIHYNIIAVTGNARSAQVQACLDAGFEAVAVKPYNFADLLKSLNTYVSLGRVPTPAVVFAAPEPMGASS